MVQFINSNGKKNQQKQERKRRRIKIKTTKRTRKRRKRKIKKTSNSTRKATKRKIRKRKENFTTLWIKFRWFKGNVKTFEREVLYGDFDRSKIIFITYVPESLM
ncbi:hypothetical protein ACTFIY_005968 [Dictyostelium cf. discoideum]